VGLWLRELRFGQCWRFWQLRLLRCVGFCSVDCSFCFLWVLMRVRVRGVCLALGDWLRVKPLFVVTLERTVLSGFHALENLL